MTEVMAEADFLSYLNKSYLMKLTAPMSAQLSLKSRVISMFLSKYIFFHPGENLPGSAALGFT